jgi:SAM-dependent methyltransferase
MVSFFTPSSALLKLSWVVPVLSWTTRSLLTPSTKPRITRILPLRIADKDDADAVRSIYSTPALYDLAFGYRDYEEEVEFLLNTHERLGGRPAVSVLELAAGPARHSLAALTFPSIQSAICVDKSSEMASYARDIAAELLDDETLSSFQYRIEDMRTFQLKDGDQKVDTAWILLGSLQHLVENQDVIQCLQSVSQALQDDGTLILELPHPRETFSMVECTRNGWEIPLEDEDGQETGKLKIVWGDEDDAFDPIRQVRQFTVAMDLKGEDLDTKQREIQNIREVVPMRLFTAQEIDALALCANMEVTEMFGALEEGVAIDDDELAFRLVCVLRKRKG